MAIRQRHFIRLTWSRRALGFADPHKAHRPRHVKVVEAPEFGKGLMAQFRRPIDEQGDGA